VCEWTDRYLKPCHREINILLQIIIGITIFKGQVLNAYIHDFLIDNMIRNRSYTSTRVFTWGVASIKLIPMPSRMASRKVVVALFLMSSCKEKKKYKRQKSGEGKRDAWGGWKFTWICVGCTSEMAREGCRFWSMIFNTRVGPSVEVSAAMWSSWPECVTLIGLYRLILSRKYSFWNSGSVSSISTAREWAYMGWG